MLWLTDGGNLRVIGRAELNDYLSQVTLESGISQPVHEQLLKYVREYMVLGGMPAVIQKYLEDHDHLPSNSHEIKHKKPTARLFFYP